MKCSVNGRIPIQIVFVEPGTATVHFTTGASGANAIKYSTKTAAAFYTTLTTKAFRIYTDGDDTYLTVNAASNTQFHAEFGKLSVNDQITIGTNVYRILSTYASITDGAGGWHSCAGVEDTPRIRKRGVC